MRGVLSLTAAAAALCSACHAPASLPSPIALAIAGHQVSAEIAATEQEQERGLQGRVSLADDAGMLFVLRGPSNVCMWMRGTPVALSVAFLDAEGRILNIEDMEPNSDTEHCSARPATYALEVRRGWFAERAISPGQRAGGLPRPRA